MTKQRSASRKAEACLARRGRGQFPTNMTWEVRFSNSRQLPYFYNPDTQVSMWELPEGVTEEQARQLPGGQLLGEAQPDQPLPAQEQVRASHLLVKHKDSRRPSSWKEANITRTKEEAADILKQHQAALGPNPTPEQFSQLASQHSYVPKTNPATARPRVRAATSVPLAAARCRRRLKRRRLRSLSVVSATLSRPTAVFTSSSAPVK